MLLGTNGGDHRMRKKAVANAHTAARFARSSALLAATFPSEPFGLGNETASSTQSLMMLLR